MYIIRKLSFFQENYHLSEKSIIL